MTTLKNFIESQLEEGEKFEDILTVIPHKDLERDFWLYFDGEFTGEVQFVTKKSIYTLYRNFETADRALIRTPISWFLSELKEAVSMHHDYDDKSVEPDHLVYADVKRLKALAKIVQQIKNGTSIICDDGRELYLYANDKRDAPELLALILDQVKDANILRAANSLEIIFNKGIK